MSEAIEALRTKIIANLTEILELRTSLKTKEIEKHDFAKEIFLGIIEIIDAHENKEVSLHEKTTISSDSSKTIQSFSVIRKKMLNLLAKYGITRVEFPENRLIIGFSKVVGTEPDHSRRNDDIISIVRNGYIRGHEVIREAEVIIVKN